MPLEFRSMFWLNFGWYQTLSLFPRAIGRLYYFLDVDMVTLTPALHDISATDRFWKNLPHHALQRYRGEDFIVVSNMSKVFAPLMAPGTMTHVRRCAPWHA